MRGRRLRVGARQSLLEAASEGAGARRKGQPRAFAHRGRDAHPGGGGAVASRREAARAQAVVAVVAWARRGPTGPSLAVARLRQALRPGAYLPLSQTGFGMDNA